jgi:hypothetical protein
MAMYNELNTNFDFITVVSQRPLWHIGFYESDNRFVHGYDRYQSAGANSGLTNPLNSVGRDIKGDEIITTPIMCVILCENSFSRFDLNVAEGRNFLISDFSHNSPGEPVPVVLGSAYTGIYELGDVFSLMYLSAPMDFQVVGFYEQGLRFSMAAGAREDVNLDYNIIMPYFIPMYEPVGEDAIFQHGFHIAELTSGYIAITENIAEINDDTHARYMAIVEQMAEKHGLAGLYLSPLWPVGFVW